LWERSEAVNPAGELDNARTASATRRMRGLLRSIPPTLVLPTCVGWGRFSSVSSLTKHASIQPTAFKNLSTIEGMDAAQVGRNFAEGKGFTTEFIRPFSMYLVRKHQGDIAQSLADYPERGVTKPNHPKTKRTGK
jgi:hypothetical protein